MASIHLERTIEASPDDCWAALRDWGALHERLVPGFVVAAQLDGEDRVVTFSQRRCCPRAAAQVTGELMERGIDTVKQTLEASASST